MVAVRKHLRWVWLKTSTGCSGGIGEGLVAVRKDWSCVSTKPIRVEEMVEALSNVALVVSLA